MKANRSKLAMWAIVGGLLIVGALTMRGQNLPNGNPAEGDVREAVLAQMQADGWRWDSPSDLSVVYGANKDQVNVTGPMLDPVTAAAQARAIAGTGVTQTDYAGRSTAVYQLVGQQWTRVRRGGVRDDKEATTIPGGY